MAIESVGGVVASDSATQRAGLTQEDFLEVLLAQLSYQDPLDPLDNKDFIAQLAQFAALEQDRQVNDKLDTLLRFQSAAQAIGLIGKTVEVTVDGGTAVGQIVSTAFREGAPVLTIRTPDNRFLADIGLGQIAIVR